MTDDAPIYEDKRLRAFAHPYAPDGPNAKRLRIEHPGASIMVPVLADGRIVLIKNHRFCVSEQLIELPAGTIEPPESALCCAQRELQEETGYKARRWRELGSFFLAPAHSDERMFVFVAEDLVEVGQSLAPGECIDVAIETPDAVVDLIRSAAIHDSKTLAALHLYFLES